MPTCRTSMPQAASGRWRAPSRCSAPRWSSSAWSASATASSCCGASTDWPAAGGCRPRRAPRWPPGPCWPRSASSPTRGWPASAYWLPVPPWSLTARTAAPQRWAPACADSPRSIRSCWPPPYCSWWFPLSSRPPTNAGPAWAPAWWPASSHSSSTWCWSDPASCSRAWCSTRWCGSGPDDDCRCLRIRMTAATSSPASTIWYVARRASRAWTDPPRSPLCSGSCWPPRWSSW